MEERERLVVREEIIKSSQRMRKLLSCHKFHYAIQQKNEESSSQSSTQEMPLRGMTHSSEGSGRNLLFKKMLLLLLPTLLCLGKKVS